MDDRAVVALQLGRCPRALLRVARRCPHGAPAVTEQAPYDDAGEPFPTSYYVTCPHLVSGLARIEAAGGVERWTGEVERDPALRVSLERAERLQRELRRLAAAGRTGVDGGASFDLGVGGSSRTGSLKCLHAHAAFALARPGYELGERIIAELDPLWPARCCMNAYDPAPMSAILETSRHQWMEGSRRLDAAATDSRLHERLIAEVELVQEELARRVGQTFGLEELARAYGESDRWVGEVVAERAPPGFRPQDLSIAQDAGFHLFSRAAYDFEP